jgi:hypothetical protein
MEYRRLVFVDRMSIGGDPWDVPPLSHGVGSSQRFHKQQSANFFGGLRRTKIITLHLGAAFGAHDLELLFGFDPLRRGGDAHPGPEARQSADDDPRVLPLGQAGDKGAVDLDPVEWKLAKVG